MFFKVSIMREVGLEAAIRVLTDDMIVMHEQSFGGRLDEKHTGPSVIG